mmetsp:Transcript_3155/g.3649  ORF Transcript_3155/g.3649 Transcript_3155/m.3649 type:complete len:431 (-) Transcript_3155:102-1394(-)
MKTIKAYQQEKENMNMGYKIAENELLHTLHSHMKRGCLRSILSTIQMLITVQKTGGDRVGLNYIVSLFLKRGGSGDVSAPAPLYYASKHYNVSDFFLCLLFVSRISITPDIFDRSQPFEKWFKLSGTHSSWSKKKLLHFNDLLNKCIMGGQNTSVIRLFKDEPQTVGGVIARLQYMLDSVWKNSYQAVHKQKQISEPYTIIKKRLDDILNTVSDQDIQEATESPENDLYEYKRYANLDMIEESKSTSEPDDESTLLGLDLLTASTRGTSIKFDKVERNEMLMLEDDETSSLLLGLDLLSHSTQMEVLTGSNCWGVLSEHHREWNVTPDIDDISGFFDFTLSHNQSYIEVTLQSPFNDVVYSDEQGEGQRAKASRKRYENTTRAFERRYNERKGGRMVQQVDKVVYRKKLQRSLASYANKVREDDFLRETN